MSHKIVLLTIKSFIAFLFSCLAVAAINLINNALNSYQFDAFTRLFNLMFPLSLLNLLGHYAARLLKIFGLPLSLMAPITNAFIALITYYVILQFVALFANLFSIETISSLLNSGFFNLFYPILFVATLLIDTIQVLTKPAYDPGVKSIKTFRKKVAEFLNKLSKELEN